MAKFIYKAKKGLSETVEGSIFADNQEEVLSELNKKDLFPVYITKVDNTAEETPLKITRSAQPGLVRKRVNSKEILIFTQKLGTLTRAKVDLLASLKVIDEQTESPALRYVIQEICDSIREGMTFSESLEKFPKIFSPLFVNIIKAGETSGRLDYSLNQLSEFLLREESLKNKVLVAMAYPVLLLSVGLGSIFVLMNFVVPKLKPLFEGLGRDLPLITKIILQVSVLSNKTWIWVVCFILLCAVIIYLRRGAGFYSSAVRTLKLNAPVIKRLARNQELVHFSKALSLLLNSGVVALKALEISTLTIDNPKLKEELKSVYKEVASGESISKKMDTLTSLPKFFTKMIAVGEESGKLGEVLEEISRSYTQQIESDITLVSSLLEPILILALGLVLGTIVLSILLPVFQVTQFVH